MAITQEGLEWAAEYSLVGNVNCGTYEMSAADTGTLTAGCALTTGDTLVMVCTSDMGSGSCAIYLCGSNGAAATFTATCYITSLACVGFGFLITASGCNMAEITTVVASGGQSGDTFKIMQIPLAANRTSLEFIRNLRDAQGTTYRDVPKGYNSSDHAKLIRGANTIGFEAPRESGHTGLNAMNKRRSWTLLAHCDTDGDGVVIESIIFSKISGNLSHTNPIEVSGEALDSFDGTFDEAIVIRGDI